VILDGQRLDGPQELVPRLHLGEMRDFRKAAGIDQGFEAGLPFRLDEYGLDGLRREGGLSPSFDRV